MEIKNSPEAMGKANIILHDCGHGNIAALEDSLHVEIQTLSELTPDPLAPIGEYIAHSLAWARARDNAERIAEIHAEHEQERKSA